jgi:hypothetical protein
MDSIKDIIPRIIAPLSQGQANAMNVGEAWKRLYGGDKGSSAVGYKEGCLTVHVDCAARLVKMNLNKAEYLEELKKRYPQMTNIRFKVGKT